MGPPMLELFVVVPVHPAAVDCI